MYPYHQLGGHLPGNLIRHNSKFDLSSVSTNIIIFKQSCQESKYIGYQQVKLGPLSNVPLSSSAQSMSNQDTKEPSYSKMRRIGLKISKYEPKRFSQLLFYPSLFEIQTIEWVSLKDKTVKTVTMRERAQLCKWSWLKQFPANSVSGAHRGCQNSTSLSYILALQS